MIWMDLHMHSNCSSDGELSPKKLLGKCSEEGLKVIALTDHNSVNGVEDAMKHGEVLGLEVIPGVELDCLYGPYVLHVLGYGMSLPCEGLKRIGDRVHRMEQAASSELIEKAKDLGIAFDEDRLKAKSFDGVVTAEMIVELALLDERNRHNPLLMPYRDGGSRSDNPYVNFYWDYCSPGKPAYVALDFISLEEAIKTIHESGGIAVLAHPGKTIGRNEKVFAEIVGAGIQGVEVYSSYHDHETAMFYETLAQTYGIIRTCGSDFHGKTKPAISLGTDLDREVQTGLYQALKALL